MALSKESGGARLLAPDIRRELVDVPEWNEQVWIRGMTGSEKNSLFGEQGARDRPQYEHWYGRVLVRCIVDETGGRIYQDTDAEALGQQDAAALERMFGVAMRLSGLGPTVQEELAKNSESTPTGGTASA